MTASQSEKGRHNNFGSLRLLFAALVVVSHSPELIDGTRHRELLTMAFGTMSFGELAVDGFFIVSGYLIAKSMVDSRSVLDFMIKRCARIIPGYVVAFWFAVLFIAPWVTNGPVFTPAILGTQVFQTLKLATPHIPHVFDGLPVPALNGAMWTIGYEFRCYLAIAALGAIGALNLRTRPLILAAAIALLAVNIYTAPREPDTSGLVQFIFRSISFGSMFAMGTVFYLFRDRITLSGRGAAISAAALFALMFWDPLAHAAFAIFGSYLVFWFAFNVPVLKTSKVDNKVDISYGLYLYAWPIQSTLIYVFRDIDPITHCLISLILASLAGLASWKLVEEPALRFVRNRRAPRAKSVQSA